mgnify:CR=1 FL=1
MQINKMFGLNDINHIIKQRVSPVGFLRFSRKELMSKSLVPTKIPKSAILSLENSRLHIFTYDSECVRRCLWDGHVTYDNKKIIVNNMLKWLNETGRSYDYYIFDHEDGCVFSDVIEEF